MKKINRIASKFVIYAKNLLPMTMALFSKNSIKYEIPAITQVNLEVLLIIFVI